MALPPVLAFLGLGPGEIVFILFIILLLFGAAKLPESARAMGRSLGEFQKGKDDLERKARSEISGASSNPTYRPVTPVSGAEEAEVRRQAEALGIDTEGRTVEWMRTQIAQRKA